MDLERWYSPRLLVKSTGEKPWRSEFADVLSYQMAIADLKASPAFTNRVVQLDSSIVQEALSDAARIALKYPGNKYLSGNVETFTRALGAPLCVGTEAHAESWYADINHDDANAACVGTAGGKRRGLPWEVSVKGHRVICGCQTR